MKRLMVAVLFSFSALAGCFFDSGPYDRWADSRDTKWNTEEITVHVEIIETKDEQEVEIDVDLTWDISWDVPDDEDEDTDVLDDELEEIVDVEDEEVFDIIDEDLADLQDEEIVEDMDVLDEEIIDVEDEEVLDVIDEEIIDPCSLCLPEEICCNEVCVDSNTDPLNCGQCGFGCTAPINSSVACVDAQCISQCKADWGDCNDDPSDGCESELNTIINCGGCGIISCGDCEYVATCGDPLCDLNAGEKDVCPECLALASCGDDHCRSWQGEDPSTCTECNWALNCGNGVWNYPETGITCSGDVPNCPPP